MPIINSVAAMQDEVASWRRDMHENPEILYEVHRTAGLVAEKLKAFGCDEVVPGIGRTGVVGVIKGRKAASGKVIGMRADMDALPMTEDTNLPYASKVPGRMHACGHDGHTAMLLGAAKYLCQTRNFDGTAIVIFQPAEEGGAGGKAMVDDGLMERWNIQEVYGMHNMPGIPAGEFAIRPGPLLAASDTILIDITGKGGHAARPHECIDPVLVGSHIVTQLHSVVSRNVDPLKSAVISMCMFHAGEAVNVIPASARLQGTARTLDPKIRDLIERRVIEVAETTARLHGATAKATYERKYPVTTNHASQTAFAASVAADVAGTDKVDTDTPPLMGGEDFSFMLEARPGAFIFIGNGKTAGVHHPKYDFNDAALPAGISYWARLVETAMPA
ncbi:MAG TPA: M20 aminoacylase family protein [Hyphomicrobiaceae bacterium]|jgi:hippurate hydrolase|nr:M20 aminoacylase family protein [Hyphomicrobiaceae bacterium]